MTKPKIAIQKVADGIYEIRVAGERWGTARPQSHGSSGTSYDLLQEGAHYVRQPSPSDPKSMRVVRIDGDKRAARNLRGVGIEIEPFGPRLIKLATELVEAGHLRDPKVIRAEKVAEADKARQSRERAEDARKERFRAKAREALMPLPNAEDCVDRIVEAMEWAQTQ